MSHRIARLVEPLLKLLRRPCRGIPSSTSDRVCRCLDFSYADDPYVNASGPTVHHTGYRPPTLTSPIAMFGIGVGSLGMLAADAEVAK